MQKQWIEESGKITTEQFNRLKTAVNKAEKTDGRTKNGGRRKGAGRKQVDAENRRVDVKVMVKKKYALKAKIEMQKIADKFNGFL